VASPGHPPQPNERRAIACPTSSGWNPYLDLLYGALAREGVPFEPDARLTARWLLGARRRVRWLHVHWPQSLYRFSRGPRALRGVFSWLKLGVFAARLTFARGLGYRLVWTIHQVLPHEGASRLDLAAAHLLGRRADLLVAHDEETAARAVEIVRSRHVAVVPHGSYVGVYRPGEGRAAARVELGIDDERVALSFGELRGYKDMDVLVDAFAQVQAGGLLLVAGSPKDKRLAAELGEAAERDSRIRFLPRFVPDERVSDFFAAADVAVVPRGDGGTSGSLILALSFGVPVVAADTATYRELLGDGEAGWLFAPGDPVSLATALDAAFSAPEEELRRRAELAAAQAASLDWDESARRLAALLRGRYT
jgi:glycosyltransferase involved in cell wall biosynthesis